MTSTAPRTSQLQTLASALIAREQSALSLLSQRYYRVREVAQALSVHEGTVGKWIRLGHLRAVRTGKGRWRIPESELLRLGGKGGA
jgi:excisionase family DNA binding protein